MVNTYDQLINHGADDGLSLIWETMSNPNRKSILNESSGNDDYDQIVDNMTKLFITNNSSDDIYNILIREGYLKSFIPFLAESILYIARDYTEDPDPEHVHSLIEDFLYNALRG